MHGASSTKRVLTTGEVAKLCSVAPRTVSKWFDSGRLRGYRIPGSKDRRIPIDQLVSFMRAHEIPLNGLVVETRRVVLLDGDRSFTTALQKALREAGDYDAIVADSAFEAGALVSREPADALIVDVQRPDVQTNELRRYLRATPDLRELFVIAIGSNLDRQAGQALIHAGFGGFLAKPFDVRTLIELIESRHSASPSPNSSLE